VTYDTNVSKNAMKELSELYQCCLLPVLSLHCCIPCRISG
jgi:hypothetical protein